MNLTFTPS